MLVASIICGSVSPAATCPATCGAHSSGPCGDAVVPCSPGCDAHIGGSVFAGIPIGRILLRNSNRTRAPGRNRKIGPGNWPL